MTSSNKNAFHITDPLWGNPPVTGGSSHKRPVMWGYEVAFDVSLKRLLNKKSSCRWFVTPWHTRLTRFAIFGCSEMIHFVHLTKVHFIGTALHWRHNGHNSVSNHQPHDCLFNRLFRRRSKETSKLRVTGLCAWNSPVPGEFPAQRPVTRKMFPFDDVIMMMEWINHMHSLRKTIETTRTK